ncbi:MAG: tRNA pseudouridine(55) synthase, partial [Chlorobi bacterium]|nr:tRNA pseudouridine(55) synthase [Chlorobiota bacterium]
MVTDIKASLDRFTSPEGGILLVDKAPDWTSFDVVKKVRNLFHLRKVGHAGTLDPSATGLLILCSNQHTRKVHEYQELPKEYTGTMKLGWITDSLDADTEEKDPRPFNHINEVILQETALQLVGDIEQIPPMYSALKKKGKRLYTLA